MRPHRLGYSKAALPRTDLKTCKGCLRHVSECGILSHTRLCEECGELRRRANFDDLTTKSGPYYVHMLRRRLLGTHRRLLAAMNEPLDDSPPNP